MTYDSALQALGDGTRRTLVELLRSRPRTVGELTDAVPVSQPAVSQHLKVLREAGLVTAEKDGVRRIYRLRPEGWAPLRAWVESFWDEALEAFRSSFETPEEG